MAQADLDKDGANELILAGVNNGEHQATVVVLDPLRVSGLMTPPKMRDQRFRLLDMQAANEKAVVLFPRSCISSGLPYTRAPDLHVTRDRIIAEVAEGEDESGAGFVYELDYGLHVLSIVPNGGRVM